MHMYIYIYYVYICIDIYYIILYYIVLYCIVLYYIILYYIILYNIILYYIIYYIILYYIILYYIILYYIYYVYIVHIICAYQTLHPAETIMSGWGLLSCKLNIATFCWIPQVLWPLLIMKSWVVRHSTIAPNSSQAIAPILNAGVFRSHSIWWYPYARWPLEPADDRSLEVQACKWLVDCNHCSPYHLLLGILITIIAIAQLLIIDTHWLPGSSAWTMGRFLGLSCNKGVVS